MAIEKHLYKRTIKRKNRVIKAWYYWYYDENGKQIRKSCGTDGKPCLTKWEAQAFIDRIVDEPVKEEFKITLYEFAKDMYEPNSKYLLKRQNKTDKITEATRKHSKKTLMIFLNQFGSLYPDELEPADVDDWLLEMDISNSYRNHIITRIQEVYKELYIKHLVKSVPLFERYKRNDQNPRDILFPTEIRNLFPDDYNELIKKWTVLNYEPETDIYKFATMIYLILTTGMRSCEARALQWGQFVQDDAILLNAMMDSGQNRVNKLKKGNQENRKWRVTILPDKTVMMINRLKVMEDNIKPDDFVFTRKGEPISTYYLLNHMKEVFIRNGIDVEGRNIVVHSLRFTYNTMMKREISGDDLRLMMGHTSKEMTEYYDRSRALDNLPGLLKNKDIINSVFN